MKTGACRWLLGCTRRQDHGGFARRGFFAATILEPDIAIDQMLAALDVFTSYLPLANHFGSWLVHAAILDRQFAQPAEFTGKIGHELSEKGILQCAMDNYPG